MTDEQFEQFWTALSLRVEADGALHKSSVREVAEAFLRPAPPVVATPVLTPSLPPDFLTRPATDKPVDWAELVERHRKAALARQAQYAQYAYDRQAAQAKAMNSLAGRNPWF